MVRLYHRIKRILDNSSGSTLIEMIMCFLLLSIFMACAAAIIATVSTAYYDIKGETYAKQVSDIVLEKVCAEIDGARKEVADKNINGVSTTVPLPHIDAVNSVANSSIELYDKTNTHIIMYADNGKLIIYYYPILYKKDGVVQDDSLEGTNWYFSDSVYNSYKIQELKFFKNGDDTSGIASEYGLGNVNMADYGDDVILVLLKLESSKYDDYYTFRFVKMYNNPLGTES